MSIIFVYVIIDHLLCGFILSIVCSCWADGTAKVGEYCYLTIAPTFHSFPSKRSSLPSYTRQLETRVNDNGVDTSAVEIAIDASKYSRPCDHRVAFLASPRETGRAFCCPAWLNLINRPILRNSGSYLVKSKSGRERFSPSERFVLRLLRYLPRTVTFALRHYS